VNEFDDVDQLERECGPALRLALRHRAADISDDTPAWQPEPTFRSVNGKQVGDVDVRAFARGRRPHRRWMMATAASIVVLVVGLLAVAGDKDRVRFHTDTVPPTPAPSISPATTSSPPLVDLSPATLPVPTTPTHTPPAPGKEITVTADLIQFGDLLVGVTGVVRTVGRTYVAAGHFDGEDRIPDSKDLWWFSPETFVLAAFDDAGVELWRTELDWWPGDMVVVDGDLWVSRHDGDRSVSRIDASTGRILGQLNVRDIDSMVEAFGSLWATTTEPSGVGVGAGRLVQIDPDLSTTSGEHVSVVTTFEECILPDDGGYCPEGPAAGAGAMWLPLGPGGVAMIDPVTLAVTVIPVDDIGHEVLQVAVDDDVAYVASHNQVTSIVDGEVVATVNPGEIHYIGPIDGAFGVLLWPGTFQVLRADHPMVVETRQISLEGETGGVDEVDGEAWVG
jgi:hypothetical protein